MTERLYGVGIRHKESGEKITVEVWGKSPEDATAKLLNSLIGIDKRYAWTGTGPVYKNNKTIEREVTP